MAKASINTGETGQAVHTRTSADATESQVVVIGTDGSDAVLDPSTLATQATLAAILSAVDGLETLLTPGAYAYAAGTAPATVDVPANARVRRVSLAAGDSAATITIAGGSTITVPANGSFDEQIPGNAALGGDVVIGGAVASYYVAWTV